MSFNDSFAGYLLFEIMMRVLNNKNRKNEKSCKHRLCPRYDQQIYQCDEEAGESHTGKSTTCCPRAPNAVDPLGQNKNPPPVRREF